jgi:hypothetical protein
VQGQSGVDGGPKGSHYTAFLGLGKRWCYINRWNAGMWYEYNKGAKRGLNFYEELPKSFPESNLGAVLIGDEFIFGKLSIIGNVGYYLFKGSGKGFFEQAGAQYILYTFNKEKQKQLYTGIILKESNFDAEYFEWHVGFRF